MYLINELFSGALGVYDHIGLTVSGVSADSRKIKKGDAFVCLRSRNEGGEAYIEQAVVSGANVIVCDCSYEGLEFNAVVLIVKNVRNAYAVAVSKMYGEPSKKMKMIAVTGTNGKTTVTKMIQNALKVSGKRVAVIGTLGAEMDGEVHDTDAMTTPDPEVLYRLLRRFADLGAEYVVMEASSHALALSKLDGINFSIAAVTNVTAEHLDFHGNMDSYRSAKEKLFEICDKGVFLIDDYNTTVMYENAKCDKVSCSVKDEKADYHAENIGYSFENGTVLTAVKNKERYPLYSRIPAVFTASNVLVAFTVLFELGIKADKIYKGISTLYGVDGRMQRVNTNGDFSVVIDFAHTPDAMAKVITSIRTLIGKNGRIVTVFGCGGDRDKSKRSLMGAIASHLSDMVIVTSDNSRSEEPSVIIDEIMRGVDKSRPHVRIEDRREAIRYAVVNAEKNDVILLLGKGHEKYEIGKEGKMPFCEADIVYEVLKNERR